MRPTKIFLWLLICGATALLASAAPAQSGAAARVAGHIVAAKVTGQVTATNGADKTSHALQNNDILYQNYTVVTGGGSSVILVFSNGATLNIGADSTLSIDEYLQDPLDKEIALADLKEEPSSSVTKLNLSRGELVGNVKHLHEDKGSSFTVNTPVGAAGIRGTIFRIVFRPDSTGKVFYTLSTAEGKVLLEGAAAASVSVETGKEVTVNVDVKVDTVTGAVTVTAPPQVQATQDIPAATKATIAAAAQEITQVTAAVVIVSNQQAAEKAAADKAAADKVAADKAAADKAAAEKAAAEKAAAEKAAAEKAAAEKAAAEKAAAEKAAAEKAAAEKAAADKAAADKAAADKAAADKAAADKAAADKAASDKAAADAKAASDAQKSADAQKAADAAKAAADAAKQQLPAPPVPVTDNDPFGG